MISNAPNRLKENARNTTAITPFTHGFEPSCTTPNGPTSAVTNRPSEVKNNTIPPAYTAACSTLRLRMNAETVNGIIGNTQGVNTAASPNPKATAAKPNRLSSFFGVAAGGAEAGVHAMLDAHPNLTAIVTPHENCVISVLQAVRARGLRIPEDLSLIGLLTESMGELATPPMTTIGFPSDELGREAARILLGRLDRSLAGPQQLLIRPELNVRGSTGPARDRV